MEIWRWLSTDDVGKQVLAGLIVALVVGIGAFVLRKRVATRRVLGALCRWVRGVQIAFSTIKSREAQDAGRHAQIEAAVEAERVRADQEHALTQGAAVAIAVEVVESRARDDARAAAEAAQKALRAAVAEEQVRGEEAAQNAAAAVETRVAEERAMVSQPTWTVRPTEVPDRFTLTTSPGFSKNVSVSAPTTQLLLDGQIHWDKVGADRHGVHIGKQIGGIVTDRGRNEGVTFTVSWHDGNDDIHVADVFLPPEAILPLQPAETVEQAYERGKAELRAQIDEERARPSVQPRWAVSRKPNGARGEFQLTNMAEGSVARDVTIVPFGDDLTIMSSADWNNLSGMNIGYFNAVVSTTGAWAGAYVSVEWADANGDRFKGRHRVLGTGT